MANQNPDELGALWVKQSARGEFMTGTINGVEIVCFRNDKATTENRQPTWRVLKSKPREDRASGSAREGLPSDRARRNDSLRSRLDEDIPY